LNSNPNDFESGNRFCSGFTLQECRAPLFFTPPAKNFVKRRKTKIGRDGFLSFGAREKCRAMECCLFMKDENSHDVFSSIAGRQKSGTTDFCRAAKGKNQVRGIFV
jgi:hypothetical protein